MPDELRREQAEEDALMNAVFGAAAN